MKSGMLLLVFWGTGVSMEVTVHQGVRGAPVGVIRMLYMHPMKFSQSVKVNPSIHQPINQSVNRLINERTHPSINDCRDRL